MAQGARVESIEAIKQFKLALLKFQQIARSSMAEVDSDINRTEMWLETEATNYWQNQIRKRHDALQRAQDALRMKQHFKDSTGTRPSAVEEIKVVRKAEADLQDAQMKLQNCRKALRAVQKEGLLYKGKAQHLSSIVDTDIPRANAKLEAMFQQLDAYVHLEMGDTTAGPAAPSEASDESSGNSTPPETSHGSQ